MTRNDFRFRSDGRRGGGFAEGMGETDQAPQVETARRWECGWTGPAAQNSGLVQNFHSKERE